MEIKYVNSIVETEFKCDTEGNNTVAGKFTEGDTVLAFGVKQAGNEDVQVTTAFDTSVSNNAAASLRGIAEFSDENANFTGTIEAEFSYSVADMELNGSYSLKSESTAVGHGLDATFSNTTNWGIIFGGGEIFHKRDDFTGTETNFSAFIKLIMDF